MHLPCWVTGSGLSNILINTGKRPHGGEHDLPEKLESEVVE
jgi:hypothetical protein